MATKKTQTQLIRELREESKNRFKLWQDEKDIAEGRYRSIQNLREEIKEKEKTITRLKEQIEFNYRETQEKLMEIIRWQVNPETAKEETVNINSHRDFPR